MNKNTHSELSSFFFRNDIVPTPSNLASLIIENRHTILKILLNEKLSQEDTTQLKKIKVGNEEIVIEVQK